MFPQNHFILSISILMIFAFMVMAWPFGLGSFTPNSGGFKLRGFLIRCGSRCSCGAALEEPSSGWAAFVKSPAESKVFPQTHRFYQFQGLLVQCPKHLKFSGWDFDLLDFGTNMFS